MGREKEGKASLGAVLAESCFSHSLTCCAGQWLEFPMHLFGRYLVKLAVASCAKESHQADIQHQLKREKTILPLFPRQPRDRPSPKAQGTGLGLPAAAHLQCSDPHLSLACWVH